MNKSFSIVLFLVGAVVGFGGGYYTSQDGGNIGGLLTVGEDTANEIISRLQEKGYLFPEGVGGRSLVGTVEKISGSRITLSVDRPSAIDVILEKDDVRTVNIDDAAIVRQENRSPEEIQQEQARLDRERTDSNAPPNIASPVKEVVMSASDISVGDTVLVETDGEIGEDKEFDAVRVVIFP